MELMDDLNIMFNWAIEESGKFIRKSRYNTRNYKIIKKDSNRG